MMGANLFQGGYCLAVSVAIVLEKCALFTQIMGLVALHGTETYGQQTRCNNLMFGVSRQCMTCNKTAN